MVGVFTFFAVKVVDFTVKIFLLSGVEHPAKILLWLLDLAVVLVLWYSPQHPSQFVIKSEWYRFVPKHQLKLDNLFFSVELVSWFYSPPC